MKVRIIKIGNSRGIRLPKKIIDLYGLREGAELEIKEEPDGIFLEPQQRRYTLPREEAYREMAAEKEEQLEWDEWDSTAGDGIDD
ncbi:MAG: AbrB/MazE/SpoVT family DNA-binding domain-containing protein [Spirochaetales bacterium]|nr:AbrB/MazE/SpoVT family DNA-binding domain-containing protein [Spirochaetales bacterium]MCF7938975.1 AbrB/MazE/SpoVT family DNA-binding domain-containing protein [Spirochaetales bacterium]